MKNRTELSYQVSAMISRLGFPAEFAEIVGNEMNTDFTAKMMIGYLRDARPTTMEDIANEMLGILEFRETCMQKQIQKRKHRKGFAPDSEDSSGYSSEPNGEEYRKLQYELVKQMMQNGLPQEQCESVLMLLQKKHQLQEMSRWLESAMIRSPAEIMEKAEKIAEAL